MPTRLVQDTNQTFIMISEFIPEEVTDQCKELFPAAQWNFAKAELRSFWKEKPAFKLPSSISLQRIKALHD